MKSLQRIIAVLLGIVGLVLVVPLFRNIYFGQVDDRGLSSIYFMFLWLASFPLALVMLLARSFGSKPKRKDLD